MAAGVKDVKNRMNSITSTRQITNAMKLVASSKLRKAKAQAQGHKEYFDVMYETLADITENAKNVNSIFLRKHESDKKCIIVIAGDRGLAGGYNNNVFKASQEKIDMKDLVIAIGRKSVDYYRKRNKIMLQSYNSIEKMSYEDVQDLAELVINEYKEGKFEEVNIIYTEFVSTLSQEVRFKRLLPLSHEMIEREDKEAQTNWGQFKKASAVTQFEPDVKTVLDKLIPMYLTTMIYGAITQSFASEQAARRTSMESATDNADEMLEKLGLQYNRARQATVTQEITEIVGGVEALK